MTKPQFQGLYCSEGYACTLPLQPTFWLNNSVYLSLLQQAEPGFPQPFDPYSPASPDSLDLMELYLANELCEFCRTDPRPIVQAYSACYLISQHPDACDQARQTPPVSLGICMPCQGGQYCPSGVNSSIGFSVENKCPSGNYCPSFGEMIQCPVGFFCPLSSRHPIPCMQEGTYCDVGSNMSMTDCAGGFYCPSPSQQLICPKRHFCQSISRATHTILPCPTPFSFHSRSISHIVCNSFFSVCACDSCSGRTSSVEPAKCSFFSFCPEGTEVPIQVWTGIFWVIVLISVLSHHPTESSQPKTVLSETHSMDHLLETEYGGTEETEETSNGSECTSSHTACKLQHHHQGSGTHQGY